MVPALNDPIRPQVLVVDDDLISLRLFATYLTQAKIQVQTAQSAREALQILQAEGAGNFEVLLTDYRMPQKNGLELINEVKGLDETLASIVVTAEGEIGLVAESMRTGVVDFLEKPITGKDLLASVRKGLDITRQRRQVRTQAEDVQAVGKIKGQLQRMRRQAGLMAPEMVFHAREVGGDFAEMFSLEDGRQLLLCGDISGHDLQAGFVSAYFQGMVHGLLHQATPIREIARLCNEELIRGWNEGQEGKEGRGRKGTSFSLAACFLLVDPARRRIEFLNCGFPMCYYTDAAGRIECGPACSQPLGWFEEMESEVMEQVVTEDHFLYLFTDGLENLADGLEVHACSAAFHLLEAGENSPLLAQAADDVLALRMRFFPEKEGTPEAWNPLFFGRYPGTSLPDIDGMQLYWQRSLKLALPAPLWLDRFDDVLLCLREAMINALKHGCRGQEGETTTLAVSYQRRAQRLRVRVEDSGPGYQFDLDSRRKALDRLAEKNLGLTMMHALSNKLELEREGATVIMDFEIGKNL